MGTTGRFSPLRYPGGKGKLAKFMVQVIRENGLSDGTYIEPYAGGAGIAWELLITGVVRRVIVNDISPQIFAFWSSVLHHTEELCQRIHDVPLSVEEWKRQRSVFSRPKETSMLELGFSCFYLNRTNRSGILMGGLIGGRNQTGAWRMDARFNREDLVCRIRKIADCRNRVEVSQLDGVEFLSEGIREFKDNDLIYVDPPYFEKGHLLYYNAYRSEDHESVANTLSKLRLPRWVVSYDNVEPIRRLYDFAPQLEYTIWYSAKRRVQGNEIMFFNHNTVIPEIVAPMRVASS